MNTYRIALSIAVLGTAFPCDATDLEVSLRAHRLDVVFGDPLYIEVTIVNRGSGIVSAPEPSLSANTFSFQIHAPDRDVYTYARQGGGGFFGGVGKVQYRPSVPVRRYWSLFLPATHQFNHFFWAPIREDSKLVISGHYGLERDVSLVCKSGIDLRVRPRDECEFQAIWRWRTAKIPGLEQGPRVATFGLQLPIERDQVMQLATEIQPGEIADLLHLTLLMQALYRTPDEMREPGNQQLVRWLSNQVHIKRQALTIQAWDCASNWKMLSTQKTLEKVLADVRFASHTEGILPETKLAGQVR